jgi:hypothetical protein
VCPFFFFLFVCSPCIKAKYANSSFHNFLSQMYVYVTVYFMACRKTQTGCSIINRIENTKSNSSVVAYVFVARGNVFTEPLPSNGVRGTHSHT